MDDPWSITTGVFALLLSTLEAAQQTEAVVEGIRGASRAVKCALE